MEKLYTVYRHVCPNGKCYVGITSQSVNSRWHNGKGYDTQVFGRAIKKYGWENITHEILFDGLTLDEAYEKEIEMISFYKSFDSKYGYNASLGGAGASGHVVSDETREKMREHSAKMWADPKMREHLTKHLVELAKANVGRKMPENAKRKTAEALSISVLQYDKKLNLVARYPSLMDAAKSFGKSENTLICKVCKEKSKTAYGYYWRYENEPITDDERKTLLMPRRAYNAKEVLQYTKDGTFVAAYGSVHDAGRKNGFSYKAIWSAIQNIRPTAYGYKWRYANTDNSARECAL